MKLFKLFLFNLYIVITVGKKSLVDKLVPTKLQDPMKLTIINEIRPHFIELIYRTSWFAKKGFIEIKKDLIRESDAFIFVYALDDPDSFFYICELNEWVTEIKENIEIPKVLVANKLDRIEPHFDDLMLLMGKDYASKNNMPHVETIAVEPNIKNLQYVFFELLNEIDRLEISKNN